MRFSLICLLLFATATSSQAQAVVFQDSAGHRLNTWTARANNGAALAGTWTVAPNADGTVRGSWTLVNTKGVTLASGTWSAAKSANEWTGSWRASVDQHAGDYGGTWSAKINLAAGREFTNLFEKALDAVIGGNWWFGPHTGTWSIRAYK